MCDVLRVRRRNPVFCHNLWGFAFAVPALLLPIVELAKENLEVLERVYDGVQTVSESAAEFWQKLDAILAS